MGLCDVFFGFECDIVCAGVRLLDVGLGFGLGLGRVLFGCLYNRTDFTGGFFFEGERFRVDFGANFGGATQFLVSRGEVAFDFLVHASA